MFRNILSEDNIMKTIACLEYDPLRPTRSKGKKANKHRDFLNHRCVLEFACLCFLFFLCVLCLCFVFSFCVCACVLCVFVFVFVCCAVLC